MRSSAISPAKTARPLHCGTVKWFNTTKGYGFIEVAEGESDTRQIFVHASSISGSHALVEGQKVEFELSQDFGVQATRVVPQL